MRLVKYFKYALVVLVVSGCASYEHRSAEADLHAKIGTSLLMEKQYPQALAELLLAEELDPKSASIQNNLGLTYFYRNRIDLAQKHLARAVELDAGFTEARNNLARILIERGKYDQALIQLRIAEKDLTYASPQQIQMNFAIAYQRRGLMKQAEPILRANMLSPDTACLSTSMLGQNLYSQSRYEEAIALLAKPLSNCPSQAAEMQMVTALSHVKLGNSQLARRYLNHIVKKYPETEISKTAQKKLKSLSL